ncbi:MAG: hypothetical protein KatS3mg023_3662 [Armatimonadota bacterium]|nr:MAG: hypothetical protein KatS3mg023_3662 [Armatimonadota bacterium]
MQASKEVATVAPLTTDGEYEIPVVLEAERIRSAKMEIKELACARYDERLSNIMAELLYQMGLGDWQALWMSELLDTDTLRIGGNSLPSKDCALLWGTFSILADDIHCVLLVHDRDGEYEVYYLMPNRDVQLLDAHVIDTIIKHTGLPIG